MYLGWDCWSPVLIMFFPILYHKDLHFHTPLPPLLALFWHSWHLFTTQWGYSRYLYVSSYFYGFWCFKLILKLIWLELGTISIYRVCQYQVPARTPWRYHWSRSRSARYGQNGRQRDLHDRWSHCSYDDWRHNDRTESLIFHDSHFVTLRVTKMWRPFLNLISSYFRIRDLFEFMYFCFRLLGRRIYI